MAKKPWTLEELEYLCEHYADNFSQDIAHTLGRTMSSVYMKAQLMGLKKSPQFVSMTGRMSSDHPNVIASRYKRGRIPENKGKPMHADVREKVARTWFQKGNVPHNVKPEGDGALSKRQGYWYIRIALGKWRQLHTWTWEQANRPIDPKREMVKFRDGNRDNCALDNLYLCTRAENMKQNTIHRYPDDVKQGIRALIHLKGKLKNMNNIEMLRAKLFETIDNLNSGKINVEQAKAIAEIGGVIVQSAKTEVDFLKVITDPSHRKAAGTGFIPGNVGKLELSETNEVGK